MEELIRAMALRHSVRRYTDDPISEDKVKELNDLFERIREYGIDIVLHQNEDIFSRWILGYGFIKNCKNYLSFAGVDDQDLEEKVGYYGEMAILKAQSLGLNTCWVGGTYRKKDAQISNSSGVKLVCVAAIGHGETQGNPSKSKQREAYYEGQDVPQWFLDGMDAVLLAPSAVNQKKWKFKYLGGDKVEASAAGTLSGIDLGIAKIHFELGARRKVFGHPNFLFE